MDFLLSICMMVKNEESNLVRCLDSLHSLMQNIPSELIIVDNGSKDNTVGIACRYTDKVYFHPWNNNFSEMRNISISYAKGEWIFYIDADEELSGGDLIAAFLTSEISKSFGFGILSVRNIVEMNVKPVYVLSAAPRLFRNDGYFRFEGAVHNQPCYKGEGVQLDAELTHYGYLSTDKELMEKKFKRTSMLLIQELGKNPENIYNRFQLSVSYSMHGDKEEALREIEEAYRLAKINMRDIKEYPYIYAQFVKCLTACNYLQKAVEICLDGIRVEEDNLDLYFYMAQAQAMLHDFTAAVANYLKYLELLANIDNLAVRRNSLLTLHTVCMYEDAYYNLAAIYYFAGEYSSALNYCTKIESERLNEQRRKLENEVFLKLLGSDPDDRQMYSLRIKRYIQELIYADKLNDAMDAAGEYKKVIQDDVDVSLMESVIFILQDRLEAAESVLTARLGSDPSNSRLLSQLAYVYELWGHIREANWLYSKAYQSSRSPDEKLYIQENINKLMESGPDGEETADCPNKADDGCEATGGGKIRSVLFIDMDLSISTNDIAAMAGKCAFSTDLAFSGINPSVIFCRDNMPYGKIIGIQDFEDFAEYINNCGYDIVHAIDLPQELTALLREHCHAAICEGTENLPENFSVNDLEEYYLKTMSGAANLTKVEVADTCIIAENKLSIMIPTFNRPEYLARLLAFLNGFAETGFSIFILDSSREKFKAMNRTAVKAFDRLDLKYLEYDKGIDLFDKLRSGIQLVDTEYVCLCADDDFICEKGITKSLEILEKDKNLLSVKGKNLYFERDKSKLNEYDFFDGLYDYDPFVRLEKIVEGFVPSLTYQVFRAVPYKKVFSFFEENSGILPHNPIFVEYLIYFIIIMTGRIGKLNTDFNIRDKGVPRACAADNFPHSVIDGSFNDDYILFRNVIDRYCRVLNISIPDFDNRIDKIFVSFLVNFLKVPKEYVHQNGGLFNMAELETGMRQSWVWPQ